jgi:transposase
MARTLSKKLARVKPGTLFAGVDLSKDRNVVAVIDERARQLDRFSFPSDQDGFDFFRSRLLALQERHQAPAVLVGMEPTNFFWKLLATDLEEHELPYRLVNAYTVKKHREGDQLDSSKDDRRDAFTIADLMRTGKYTLTQLLHGGYAELRQHVVLYDRLSRDVRRQKIVLRNAVDQLFPEFSRNFKKLTGETASAMLRHHAAPSRIQKMSQEDFIAGVRVDLRGSRLQISRLSRIHSLAATSIGRKEAISGLQFAIRLHLETLELSQRQVEEVKVALTDIFLALPESRYLLSMPGLGLITAATILAEIGDPARFRNGRQLIKLAGTQPVPDSSGRRSRSRTPMSHKGRPRLRTALYFAVLRLIQSDDAFARQYQYLQQRPKNPLLKMEAVGVMMNKLLRVLWALMHQRTFYDPGFEPTS